MRTETFLGGCFWGSLLIVTFVVGVCKFLMWAAETY